MYITYYNKDLQGAATAGLLFLHITAQSNPCLILTKHHLIQMST